MNEQEFNSLPLAQRKAAQQRLIDAGLYSGNADGKWGPGTANAFKAEEKRRVEDADRERKASEERDLRNRQLKLEEDKVAAEAALKKAEADKKLREVKADEEKAARKAKFDEEAMSPLGLTADFGANIAMPTATGIAGFKAGKGINAGLNLAQEYMNEKLKGVAADRVAGLTTRDAAQRAVTLSGAMPIENRTLRVASRMLPHVGLGGLGIGKGAEILWNASKDDPYYAYQADRGAGLGWIGAGSGILKAGMGHASAPKVTPDSQALAVINSPQLRRSGIGAPTVENAVSMPRGPLKAIDAEVIPDEPQKALPAPKQKAEGTRQNSERLIKAARSGGATGIKNKSAAATWIEANLGDENRAAIAKELGVKPGPKFQQRVLTAVKNMAKKPGASALVPALAGGTAFLASPKGAEASRDGSDVTGRDEALTNAGIAGGLAYGTGKVIQSIPKIAGRALSGGLSMLTPSIAADAYDPSPEKLAMDRNELARILPEWMHLGAIEKAHQMAQVPERSPVGAGPRLAEPSDPDAAINEALGIVRRANGGRVSGGFHFDSGGRTDNIPIDVIPGSYIVPADVVSALGQGNTMAGIKVLDNMFPPQMEPPKAQGTAKRAEGGRVPIIVAGGEFKVDPYHVAALGEGDVQAGADMLDEWVQDVRQQHIQTLSKLPGPAESAAEEGRQRSPFDRGGMAVSEEDILLGYNPIDELRRTVNTQSYTPEQAAENRYRTMMEALSVIPGPGNVISAQDAYTGAGDAYNAFAEGDYKGGALASALAGLSGAGAVFGLPVGKYAKSAADTGADTLHIFAGPTAKTADHAALAKAQDMAASGASRDDIWRDTGWFQGVDGKWKFEIDDSGASLVGVKAPQSEYHASTFSGISHPEYEAAYGDYLPREVTGVFDPRMKSMGQYSPFNDSVFAQGPNAQAAKGTGLHEFQHHTQELEDFARGTNVAAEMKNLPADTGNSIVEQLRSGIASGDYGSPGDPMFSDAYTQLLALERQINEKRAVDAYRKSAGEVEARNVHSRMNMSAAERRAKAPWLTQDVPDDQQIVRYRP